MTGVLALFGAIHEHRERKMARIEGPPRMPDAWSTNVVDLVGEALDFLMSDA